MTRENIVSEICRQTFISRGAVSNILDIALETIGDALARGEKVQLTGFGTFEPKKRNARVGRNPHTKEAVPIPARIIPSFKPGKLLNEKVYCELKKEEEFLCKKAKN